MADDRQCRILSKRKCFRKQAKRLVHFQEQHPHFADKIDESLLCYVELRPEDRINDEILLRHAQEQAERDRGREAHDDTKGIKLVIKKSALLDCDEHSSESTSSKFSRSSSSYSGTFKQDADDDDDVFALESDSNDSDADSKRIKKFEMDDEYNPTGKPKKSYKRKRKLSTDGEASGRQPSKKKKKEKSDQDKEAHRAKKKGSSLVDKIKKNTLGKAVKSATSNPIAKPTEPKASKVQQRAVPFFSGSPTKQNNALQQVGLGQPQMKNFTIPKCDGEQLELKRKQRELLQEVNRPPPTIAYDIVGSIMKETEKIKERERAEREAKERQTKERAAKEKADRDAEIKARAEAWAKLKAEREARRPVPRTARESHSDLFDEPLRADDSPPTLSIPERLPTAFDSLLSGFDIDYDQLEEPKPVVVDAGDQSPITNSQEAEPQSIPEPKQEPKSEPKSEPEEPKETMRSSLSLQLHDDDELDFEVDSASDDEGNFKRNRKHRASTSSTSLFTKKSPLVNEPAKVEPVTTVTTRSPPRKAPTTATELIAHLKKMCRTVEGIVRGLKHLGKLCATIRLLALEVTDSFSTGPTVEWTTELVQFFKEQSLKFVKQGIRPELTEECLSYIVNKLMEPNFVVKDDVEFWNLLIIAFYERMQRVPLEAPVRKRSDSLVLMSDYLGHPRASVQVALAAHR